MQDYATELQLTNWALTIATAMIEDRWKFSSISVDDNDEIPTGPWLKINLYYQIMTDVDYDELSIKEYRQLEHELNSFVISKASYNKAIRWNVTNLNFLSSDPAYLTEVKIQIILTPYLEERDVAAIVLGQRLHSKDIHDFFKNPSKSS